MSKPETASAALRRDPPPETGLAPLTLRLAVSDPEVKAELLQRAEGEERNEYALTALRVGVLALRQAGGLVDAQRLKAEGERLITDVEGRLNAHAQGLNKALEKELKAYFDPASGHFPLRVQELVGENGKLAQVLKEHVAGDTSVLARQLAAAVGKDSPLMKHLTPGQQDGLVATIAQLAEAKLEAQGRKLLGEFDLNNESGALKRLLGQIETNFDFKNPKAGMGLLAQALEKTQEQIRRDLTLDSDDSALSNLHRKLKEQIDEMLARQGKFQAEVATVLAELRGAKQERDVSPSGGFDFEHAVGEALRKRIHSDEVLDSVGETAGLVARSKVGDHVQTMGAESAAPGAKVVYECKRAENYTHAKALSELDEARRNRGADVGVFVLAASSLLGNARMRAEFPRSLVRQGNDIIVVWDPENPASDVNLDAAVTLARALVLRQRSAQDPATEADWDAIDKAVNGIQRQIEYLDELDGWSKGITRDAGKIAERAEKMKKDLARELKRLTAELEQLRGSGG